MKLLFCKRCLDVIRLRHRFRSCACGASWGTYREDGIMADMGGQAIPIGFENASFLEAIRNQPETGLGVRFEAFTIPKTCPTIEVAER